MEKWRKLNKKLIGSRKKPVEDLVQKTLEESYTKGEERVVQAYENAKNKAELKGKAIIPEDTISEEAKKAKEIQETVTEQQGMKDIAPNKVVDKKVELPRTPRNNEELPKADPEESFFGVNEKKLNALIESVTNDLNNASTSIQRLLDDIYRQTIFKTHMYLQNGVLTLNQAVDMATKDFLDKGINSIIYKDGKRVNIASYAEMCLRTASQRATFLGEGKKRDEFGIHLVVVTAHANTCKMCAPWQGKVLIDDVFSHPSKEYIEEYSKKYRLLSEAIKNNFFHPNCRHSVTTFFEGITQIPEIPDKDKAIETYEAEQKQRAHERAIRKQKRISEGSCDEINRGEADKKVRLHQKLIRDILKEHPELRRNSNREKMDFRSIRQLNYTKDLKQFNKFKEILGEDAPKTLEDFQNLKYNDSKEWELLKSNFSDEFVKTDFDKMPSFHKNCSNQKTREWYKWHDENIPNLLDKTKTTEEQAKKAHELRNNYRSQARDLMKDQAAREELDRKHPDPTFEDLLEHKQLKYGLSLEEAYKDIIRSSQTTNKKYDKIAGIKED